MGVRGEIFSNKVILPNRTYFFNVKENRMGDLYLNIVESKNRDNGGFDRQSVILFADDLQEFLKGFDESLRVLEKASREKRHTGKKREDAGVRDQYPREESKHAENSRNEYPRERVGNKRAEKRGQYQEGNIRASRSAEVPRGRAEGERNNGYKGKRGGEFSRGRAENSRNETRGKSRQNFSGGRSSGETFRGNSRGTSGEVSRGNSSGASGANRRKDRGGDYQPKNKKRVVVKKRD